MTLAETWTPKGFYEGAHPRVSSALARKIETVGPRGGRLRVLMVAAGAAKLEALCAAPKEWPWS